MKPNLKKIMIIYWQNTIKRITIYLMNSNFYLNLPFTNNESEFLFDLNQTPTDEEIVVLNNEGDDANAIDQIASDDCFTSCINERRE